jgi:hypothetical protein
VKLLSLWWKKEEEVKRKMRYRMKDEKEKGVEYQFLLTIPTCDKLRTVRTTKPKSRFLEVQERMLTLPPFPIPSLSHFFFHHEKFQTKQISSKTTLLIFRIY